MVNRTGRKTVSEWVAGPADEDAMLAEAFNVEDNSRLGCQIQMTQEMDGLEVELAPES